MSTEGVITHEPVDDVPLIIGWLLAMHIHTLVDAVLPRPHGNWQGLSYGQIVVIWLTYMLTQCDHRMSPVEEWVGRCQEVLAGCTGWPVTVRDLTDDRLEVVLELLGDEQSRAWEGLDREMGRHLVQAYRLPSETARIDTTSFSVHHAEVGPDGQPYSLLRFGKSKDRRPDLRQFVQALGTLDPAGIPLVSVMLRGNQNDSPVYLPIWRQMVEIIGRPGFVLVGDCKLSSLGNRVQLQLAGGIYLSPLAMTGQWPEVLRAWVLDPPIAVEALRLSDEGVEETPSAEGPSHYGFVMTLGTLGTEPTSQARVGWSEQVFVICNLTRAGQEVASLRERLGRAEAALARVGQRPGSDAGALQSRVRAVLAKERVEEYLEVTIQDNLVQKEQLVGPGRSGPDRPRRVVDKHQLALEVSRRTEVIEQAEKLAGWRLYVTNASPEQMSLRQSIRYYREQWQPERGFHRWKRGQLSALPVYLKSEARIRGLMTVLSLGLRVLTLVEFVVRRELRQRQEELPGLYEGNRKRMTDRPTTERLFRVFEGITLYRSETSGQVSYQLSPLTELQQRILNLMLLPEDLYARLMPIPQFADTA